MLKTREEIASLLKKAEGNLQKTEEIYRELESLWGYIEEVLKHEKRRLNRTTSSNTCNPR